MPILVLNENEVQSLVSIDEAIVAVEAAFRKISLDEATNIPRQRCQTDHVLLHLLPAAAKTLNTIGFKAKTTGAFPKSSRIFLYDAKTGELNAILAGETIGEYRSGAAGAVAVKKLSRPDATTMGIIGAGTQARMQLLAIAKVRKLAKVKVTSLSMESTIEFAQTMSEECHVDVIPVATAEEAVQGADIVVTATRSRDPVLFGDWLSEGCHVNLIGSNFPAKVEADTGVFRRAELISVDSKDQAKVEAGDFITSLKEHIITWSDILELSHILTNRYPGRQSPTGITIFKSLGLGIHDIAVARKLADRAQAAGIGRMVDL
jgi:alanine dehydrogenase